jgi:predicted GIY-YIG superfamily endonuclease
MTSIYILKLDNGKYYVGKSNHVRQKYSDHISGNGSEWTRLYKPISIRFTE